MATTVSFNASSYSVPAVGERQWGLNVSNLLIGITAGALPKSGGAFTLTADVDFGINFGLKSVYFKSVSSNIAAAGIIRFANSEGISWRNFANDGDLSIVVSGSNRLTFGGVNIPTISSTDTLTNKTMVVASNTFTTAASGNLSATELNAALAELQTDVDSRATDVDLDTHVANTANPHAVTKAQVGLSNVDNTSDANKTTTTKGDLIVRNASANTRLPVGTDGFALIADSAETTGVKWSNVAAVAAPPGMISAYASATPPTGWLLCDGSAVSRATYAALYAVLGTTFDTKTNTSTGAAYSAPAGTDFRLPDLRAVFVRGVGSNPAGVSTTLGGYQTDTTAKNGLANSTSSLSGTAAAQTFTGNGHTHTGTTDGSTQQSQPVGAQASPGGGLGQTGSVSHSHSFTTNSTTVSGTNSSSSISGTAAAQTITGDAETRPDNVGLHYIIKT